MSALLASGSGAAVRPLRRWSASEIGRVAAALDAVVAAWASDWSVAPMPVACVPADADPAGDAALSWHALPGEPGSAWLGNSGYRRIAMRRLLAPDDRSTALAPLAAALAESAWRELATRLSDRLGCSDRATPPPHPPAPPATQRRPWSGALVARWRSTVGGTLALHLAEPAVRALVGASEAGAPRARIGPSAAPVALASQRATLRAVLAPVTLDVGSLRALAPGDVLPLAHPLDRPLDLCLVVDGDARTGQPIAHAALGARDRRRAVALVRPTVRHPTQETA